MGAPFARSYSVIVLFLGSLLSPAGVAQEAIPDVKLTVATQLKEGGVLGKEINVLTLTCFKGECRLTTLVLNRCFGSSQIPFVFTKTTQDGGVTVSRSGDILSIEEIDHDLFGDTRTTLRFAFEPSRYPSGQITELKDFSGAYVKNSDLTGTVITVEFVALRGEYERVELACPMELPGIPPAQE